MTLHFLNDVSMTLNRQKIDNNYIIITSLKIEPTCKVINRIQISHHLISSLPGSAMRTHVERSASLAIQQAFSKLHLVYPKYSDT